MWDKQVEGFLGILSKWSKLTGCLGRILGKICLSPPLLVEIKPQSFIPNTKSSFFISFKTSLTAYNLFIIRIIRPPNLPVIDYFLTSKMLFWKIKFWSSSYLKKSVLALLFSKERISSPNNSPPFDGRWSIYLWTTKIYLFWKYLVIW